MHGVDDDRSVRNNNDKGSLMVKRILIYRIGNLGDTVCAMPAMVAVRRHFPDAWIGLLTNKELAGNPEAEKILEGNDFLNEIITYHPERIRGLKYLCTILKRLHSLKIDLLVYLSISQSTYQRLIRDWLFFRLAGCRRLIGFKLTRPIRTCMQNGITIPVHPQEVDRLISLLAPLEINLRKVDFRLPIKEKDRKAVNSIWNCYELKDKNPIVAICPGAKFPIKRWNVKRFSQVALILHEDFGAEILLVGGSSEKTAGEEIVKKEGDSIINLIGKTNYMESAEVISRCNLLVSNDCGPLHLAAAVGTAVVGVYSSRDFPGAWHPWGKNHIILRNDSVSCRFCFRTECETMQCINSITAEQVVEACRFYLKP